MTRVDEHEPMSMSEITEEGLAARFTHATKLIQEAGALAARMRQTLAPIETKSPIDFCTEADHAVEKLLRDDLVARGLSPDRVTVVPNAVDDALLDPARDLSAREARARLGLPEDGLWVGTVTSVVDYEGLDLLVRAVAELRSEGRDIRAAIVGDGTARPALLELVDSLGLTDAVVLPGRVPSSTAHDWHRALDIFAVPRRDSEVTRTVTATGETFEHLSASDRGAVSS